MKQYRLVVDENQLHIITLALESYCRLGMGHIEQALTDLGFRNYDQFKNQMCYLTDEEFKSAISVIKFRFFRLSFRDNYTVSDHIVSINFKTCKYLFDLIKEKLENDENVILSDDKHIVEIALTEGE